MLSFSALILLCAPQGFAVERLYQSAPGAGWMVMDTLYMHGGFGGAVSVSAGYANNPLQVSGLAVVSDEAFANVGLAVTYDRFRVYLDLPGPLAISGKGGTVDAQHFTAPALSLKRSPDVIADPRVGFDARLLGTHQSTFRLGVSAQLYIPNGDTADYDTDGAVRAMLRVLAAGDVRGFTYATQLGVHIRPRDEPGSARGSELLYGVAAGPRFLFDDMAVVLGPEVYGEAAFRSGTTGLEGLLSARWEQLGDNRANLRVKLSVGGGLDPNFGAPEWRFALAVELFGARVP